MISNNNDLLAIVTLLALNHINKIKKPRSKIIWLIQAVIFSKASNYYLFYYWLEMVESNVTITTVSADDKVTANKSYDNNSLLWLVAKRSLPISWNNKYLLSYLNSYGAQVIWYVILVCNIEWLALA